MIIEWFIFWKISLNIFSIIKWETRNVCLFVFLSRSFLFCFANHICLEVMCLPAFLFGFIIIFIVVEVSFIYLFFVYNRLQMILKITMIVSRSIINILGWANLYQMTHISNNLRVQRCTSMDFSDLDKLQGLFQALP